MKKEAVNSFAKGLVLDMSELITTSEVYVDCLNGTLLTNNGNELSLQNDIGNVKLDKVKLNKGFVPVGIKEFGGIVYIASYNPQKKESELGCFPSPLLIFGEKDEFTNIQILLNNFVINKDKVWHIYNEESKTKLFSNDGKSKVFHLGDKFIITCDLTYFKDLIQKGVLSIRIAVLTKDGIIEYIDEQFLNKYDHKFTNQDGEEVIFKSIVSPPGEQDPKYNIFNHRSSGNLILVVSYKPYNTFLIYRKYSMGTDNNINIEFEGSTDVDSKQKMYMLYGKKSELKTGDSITISSNLDFSYTIYPFSEWGLLDSLCRSGTINITNIIENISEVTKWRFYVHDDELLIDWSYDHFNLSNVPIKQLKFTFKDLISNTDMDYFYDTTKESYKGDFTEYIPLDNINLYKNTIYECTIYAVYENNTTDEEITKLLIYTGKLFNYVTDEEYEELRLGLYNISVKASIKNDISIKIDHGQEIAYINTNKIHSLDNDLTPYDRDFSNISFTQLLEAISWNDFSVLHEVDKYNSSDTYIFVSKLRKSYTVNPFVTSEYEDTLEVSLKDSNGLIIRTFNVPFKDSLAGSFTNEYKQTTISSKAITYDSTDLEIFVGQGLYVPKAEHIITDNTIILSRGAHGYCKTLNKSLNVERMMPIYDTSRYVSLIELSSLFGFDYNKNNIIGIGGDKDRVFYNTKFYPDRTTEGDDKGAPVPGADGDSLSMACREMGGTINVFGGVDGSAASYRFGFPYSSYNCGYTWYTGEYGEIDENDNFLILCWKTAWDTSKYALINLASRKNEPNRKTVDQIIKCILSQLLIAKSIKIDVSYTLVDNTQCSYHDDFDDSFTITCNLTYGFLQPGVSGSPQENDDVCILNSNILNYKTIVPTVTIEQPQNVSNSFKIGKDINLSKITQFYTNEYAGPTKNDLQKGLLSEKERRYIYGGKVNSIDENGICTLEGDVILGYVYRPLEDVLGMSKPNYGKTTQDKLYFWKLKESNVYEQVTTFEEEDLPNILLEIPINLQFITKANKDQTYENLLPEYYNEVLLNEKCSSVYAQAKWVERIDNSAPGIYPDYNFGNLLKIIKDLTTYE